MEDEVKKAAEAHDGKGKKVLIALWKDGSMTVCKGQDEFEEGECYYVDPNPSNESLFYVAEAHFSSLGYKIRTLADEV